MRNGSNWIRWIPWALGSIVLLASKLDAKADALLCFYNDCDAKLSLMDRYNRDMDESRRLEELSGSIDSAIAAAEGTLAAIGAQFVREAEAMGQALGGLARIQIESLAGEVPLDNIEHLADRPSSRVRMPNAVRLRTWTARC